MQIDGRLFCCAHRTTRIGLVSTFLLLLVSALRADDPVQVDKSPIPVAIVKPFPDVRVELPVVVTTIGDGSNRLAIGSQKGMIYTLDVSDPNPKSQPFLDLTSRITYRDMENEEGLLGIAFHPRFAQNGQLFVYYTANQPARTSVVSRFQMRQGSDQVDVASEQRIWTLKQPYWNHNGGTIVFGPDGFLYIGLGDGGSADDPHKTAQDRSNWLGSILRIDVNATDGSRAYRIPADNPFVNDATALPEIWAFGLRNVWRMAFDRQTGKLWAADVGQNLYEEINLIQRGGNYGWSLREGRHKFKRTGSGPRKDLIEPVWEYDHRHGKSITGGVVYRGQKIPQLAGCYLYGDYVSGRLWALRTDPATGAVIGNHPLNSKTAAGRRLPVMTFGEDEQGEVYFTTPLGGGQIFRFEPKR